jgi:2-amino-4-hydroxy-6-hydroxymethyldihydropteridine diphosphokinase
LKIAYIALGSNVGDRRANLVGAVERLLSPDLRILRASSIYETEPRDVPDQPWFLNQVIEAQTTLYPRQLLARTQKIEREMGRTRTVDKGPRVIDIDILLYGESKVLTEALEIPHPRMADRRFVLEPLHELAPELRHPVTKKTIGEMLRRVADQAVRHLRNEPTGA